MKLTAIALLSCVAATSCFGVITITITPNDATTYTLSATGSGSATLSSFGSGTLFLSGIAFNTPNGAPSAGLTFGGAAINGAAPGSINAYDFITSSSLAAGGPYSFAGGPINAAYSPGQTFATTFNPGAYTITGSSGIFGSSATGTFSVNASAIPEPSTYLAIAGFAGLGGFLIWRRRKAAKAS